MEAGSRSIQVLKGFFGDDLVEELVEFMHIYDGTQSSVKPVAKHITIYWVGRLGSEAILRTEGEDDIILTRIRDKAVPTLIFRKLKATMLRAYMETMRGLWHKYKDVVVEKVINEFKDVYGEDYDFLKCSISPGIERERGVMHGRCMKCPVDVLMGAVMGGREERYNLASRLMGDPAFATAETYRRRTGNAIDEVAKTTIIRRGREQREREYQETGALYSETVVEPGTLFVGKIVLFMPSPTDLVYTLALLANVQRYGARKSIMGSMEVRPVALAADYYEVGTAYAATEVALGETDFQAVEEKVYNYVKSEAPRRLIDLREHRSKLKKLNLEDRNLYLEAWRNAALYVKGVSEYITI